MKIIELLLFIVDRFCALKPRALEEIEFDAITWEKENKEKGTKIGKFLVKSEVWYIRLGLALSSIVVIKLIGDWIYTPQQDTIDDDDDDFDYREENMRLRKKIQLYKQAN